MKIIHLLCHTIPFRDDYVYNGWPARTAMVLNNYSKDYTHECWYAVRGISQPTVSQKNGIKYRLFPAWSLNLYLESFFGIVFSKNLTVALRKEIKSQKVIFHIHGERGLLVWQIINIAKGSPIFIQFHGYSTPRVLLLFERLFLTPFEKYYFQQVSYFFVHFKARIRYLTDICHISRSRIYNQNYGVDFDMFKPLNRNTVRKELGLPKDKNIIFYLGVYNRTKGVKTIIEAHLAVKERLNTYLVLVGGSKNDEYYNYCVANADLVKERIPHEQIPKYFYAADVYCMLLSANKSKYGGFGLAPSEALACNVPVLSSTLFEAPDKIVSKIGYTVRSKQDLIDKLTLIIDNKDNKQYNNLRQLSRPYYSWGVISKNIIKLYDRFE